jgi:hypothetical protein
VGRGVPAAGIRKRRPPVKHHAPTIRILPATERIRKSPLIPASNHSRGRLPRGSSLCQNPQILIEAKAVGSPRPSGHGQLPPLCDFLTASSAGPGRRSTQQIFQVSDFHPRTEAEIVQGGRNPPLLLPLHIFVFAARENILRQSHFKPAAARKPVQTGPALGLTLREWEYAYHFTDGGWKLRRDGIDESRICIDLHPEVDNGGSDAPQPPERQELVDRPARPRGREIADEQ